ncbi:MAG: DNA primase [Arcanobacterium sp.]|nr:DNA primase [Arcanobacterium sp.]
MAKSIKQSTIEEVKENVRLDEIIGQYLTLKTAGTDTLKGLCPFHDEKTPSFSVRPHHNHWHCFGCGESGDAIEFIRKIEHVGFIEAIEILAQRSGIQVEYEETRGKVEPKDAEIKRSRLIDAHRIARDFYIEQLNTEEAFLGRKFLADRGFDAAAIAQFQVGYSPDSWDSLLVVLRKKGFTDKEILAAGLASQGNRGIYDRFRGRLMWPIHSALGDPIGFGARKLSDDDQGPKYLNTAETLIYKKSQVLYGLDLAKKNIAAQQQVVVVEGYTDVMAAHLAGVTTAVATCGTAFGAEHAKLIRGLLGDSRTASSAMVLHNGKSFGGEVVFTFDGDAAGQKAALKAYEHDASFGLQTFVAIAPEGLDPCELRLQRGDEAVADLIKNRQPLFAFVLQSLLADLPLGTAEGRTAGLHRCVPILAQIKDAVLRQEYLNLTSGWIGIDETVITEAVAAQRAAMGNAPAQISQFSGEETGEALYEAVLKPFSEITDHIERNERAAMQIILQLPKMAFAANAHYFTSQVFTTPTYQTVHDAIMVAGTVAAFQEHFTQLVAQGVDEAQAESRANAWFVQEVLRNCGEIQRKAVHQLVAEEIPQRDPEKMWAYVRGVMMGLIRQGIMRQIAEIRGEMLRTPQGDARQEELFARLTQLEAQRRQFDETDHPE